MIDFVILEFTNYNDAEASKEVVESDTFENDDTATSNEVLESIYDGNTYLLGADKDYPDFSNLSDEDIENIILNKDHTYFFAKKDGQYYVVILSYSHNINWNNSTFEDQELYDNLNVAINTVREQIASSQGWYVDDYSEAKSIGNLELIKYLKSDSKGNEIWGYYYPIILL